MTRNGHGGGGGFESGVDDARRAELPADAVVGDYGAFTTWVELGPAAAAAARYTVRPRCAGAGRVCEYTAVVRARGGCVAVAIAGRAIGQGCAAGGGWRWVRAGAVSLERGAAVVLTVAAAGGAAVHVDTLALRLES